MNKTGMTLRAALFCALALLWGGGARAQDATTSALLDAVKANPNSFDAHFNLGVAYFNSRQYDLAAPEFKRSLDLKSGDSQSREMYESSMGISAYIKNDFAGAIAHLQEVLKVNPKNPNANMLLGNAYIQTNDYKDAEAFFNGSLATFTDNPDAQKDAHEGLAKIYMDQKNYQQAQTHLEALGKLLSRSKEADRYFSAYQNLGVAYFEMKDYADAADAWEKALKVHSDAQIDKFLGFSYYNLGRFSDAIGHYEDSLKLNPGDSETYYNLAVAYNDNGQYDEAAADFAQAFKLNPKDSNAAVGQAQATASAVNSHMEKGSNFSLNNQYSDAVAEWQQVLGYEPDNKQALDFIADAKGKLDVEVQKHYEAGKSDYQKGDSLAALTEWNDALQMDPDNEKVKSALDKLKVKTSEKVGSLLSAGDEAYAEKDYSGALQKYQQAAKLSPNSSAVKKALRKLKSAQGDAFDQFYQAGLSDEKNGNLKRAVMDFETASGVDPSSEKSKQKLFETRKNLSNQINDLLEAGASLLDGGDQNGASQKFQKVLSLDPENVKANDYITKMTGQTSSQKANSENVKSLYYEGVNLYLDNKITDAIDKWNECLKLDPGNVNARQNIAKASAKLESIKKLSGG